MSVPFAPAYCMSKRGIVGYSDALRLEYGDAIDVTTVYPGYIRTPIHDAAAEQGIALDGMVPAERLSDAARAMARAVLGRPRRDVATTPMGTLGYALMRLAPRPLVDAVIRRRIRRAVRSGLFEGSDLAAELTSSLLPARTR
jgi:NAD(P)-dependent dehydrogenase (short-subunit alcohol dehydrogenase family)